MTTDVISQHTTKKKPFRYLIFWWLALFIHFPYLVFGSSDFLIPYCGRGFGNVEDVVFFGWRDARGLCVFGASWEDGLNCEEQQRRKYDLEPCAIDFLMQLNVCICRNMVTIWVVSYSIIYLGY